MVAASTTSAQAHSAEQVVQACLKDDRATVEILKPDNLPKELLLPLIASLDEVTRLGRAISQTASASDLSMQDTIITAYGQQTDQLRTGALTGELLSSELGVLYRWEDRFLGTICLLPLPSGTAPEQRPTAPLIGESTIQWRAAPIGEAAQSVSQIIILSDRPQ